MKKKIITLEFKETGFGCMLENVSHAEVLGASEYLKAIGHRMLSDELNNRSISHKTKLKQPNNK